MYRVAYWGEPEAIPRRALPNFVEEAIAAYMEEYDQAPLSIGVMDRDMVRIVEALDAVNVPVTVEPGILSWEIWLKVKPKNVRVLRVPNKFIVSVPIRLYAQLKPTESDVVMLSLRNRAAVMSKLDGALDLCPFVFNREVGEGEVWVLSREEYNNAFESLSET